jgi:hypothetical protein
MTRRSVLTTFTSLAVAALGRRRAFAAPAALALPAGASAQKVDFGAAPIDKWTIVDGQASAG